MPNPLPPSLDALETRLGLAPGDLEGPDKTRAEQALEDAVTLVLAEVSETLATKWQAEAPDVVRLVVLTAAKRGYENPRGIQQETLGEHTVGLSETSGVYLSVREAAQIARAATKRRGYAGSIRTPSAYGVYTVSPTAFVPVSDGSAPVPLLTVPEVI